MKEIKGMTLLYEDLTRKILEACFEVSNELGAGFIESVYHRALVIALRQKGLQVRSEVPISVMFRGQNVGEFYADLLVEEKIIVELKAVSALAKEHVAQVINYLYASGMDVGLLINFGTPKMEYRRLERRDRNKGKGKASAA
jgi:GxxExxY protein